MLHTMKNNKSLTFYQPTVIARPSPLSSAYSAGIAAIPIANTELITQVYTADVNQAFVNLRCNLLERGSQYANNLPASRAGFMAEDFVADTYNLDAVIKRETTYASTPQSHEAASPDVVIKTQDGTEIQRASLKFYKDATSSAKNQLNTDYGDQVRVIPADQLEEGKSVLVKIRDKNMAKGRVDVAQSQQNIIEKLSDRILTKNGVSSTPLTREQALELADSISTEKGTIVFDRKKFKSVMEEVGIIKKKDDAIFKNEIHGIKMAAAIGAGIGFTLGFAVTLAQNGISPDSMRAAMASGTKGGMESGVLSVISYGIGRTIGDTVTTATTGVLGNMGLHITDNIKQVCRMGTVGTMMIAVFSVYQFAKLKLHGVSTQEALRQVGRQALFSLSTLAISLAIQCLFGGPAGTVISICVGVVCVLYTIGKSNHRKAISENIQTSLINECKPIII